MALTTKIIDGDLLTLRIVFPDDRTVTVTVGRGGKSVGVAPNDGKIADRLSSIFHWSAEKVGEPGYPFTSLNQVIYGMETLARSVANNLFHSFSYGGCGHSSGDRDVQGQAF